MKRFTPWVALAVSGAMFISGCGGDRNAVVTAPPLRAALGSGQFTIQIDATALTVLEVSISGVGSFSTTSPELASLDAGTYSLFYVTSNRPGGGAFFGSVFFDVLADGTVDFAPELDGVLSGRGTSTLTVDGVHVTVDASALTIEPSAAIPFNIGFVTDFFNAGSKVVTVALLPGTHAVNYRSANRPEGGAFEPIVFFDVANDGTVDFAPELDGVLSGGGTPTLLVKGARIRVDATSLASLTFDLGFVGSFSNNATQEVVVLPGTHAFAAGDLQFFFSVTQGAAVDYDPSLDATLSGRGTNTLIVWGTAATPEDRIDALIAQVRALVTQGVLSRGRGNSLTVKLQDAKRLIAIGDIAGAIQDLRDFIAEVDAFVRARILTAAQSEPLRIRANAIIVQLQSG